MTAQITSAALKIAKLHNARLKAGFGGNGFIVVGMDGSGGAWYSDNSRPALGNAIRINIRWERMTAAQAQEMLDMAEAGSSQWAIGKPSDADAAVTLKSTACPKCGRFNHLYGYP